MSKYRAEAVLDATRTFRSKAAAERHIAKVKAAFDEANKVCDGEIWTNIEIIYLTRWDCPTVRLAAANALLR